MLFSWNPAESINFDVGNAVAMSECNLGSGGLVMA